jgi:hypothetical protein
MTHSPPLKTALKRGALLAAANWPLVVVQFVAEGTSKLLIAVPVVGGIVLVILLPGNISANLSSSDLRQSLGEVIVALGANRVALVIFAAAFLLVLLGSYALTFVVKAGTVAVLARADLYGGPIERPPLRLAALRRANATEIDMYLGGCQRLWRRYLRLGAMLLTVYAITGAIVLLLGGVLVETLAFLDSPGRFVGLSVAAIVGLSVLVVWIMLVNVIYLLIQIVVAVDDVGVRSGAVRAVRFIGARLSDVAGIFGVVLLLVVLAMAADILATAGLGLIAFVPLAGLAVVPLQVAAWLVRGFVFEYLALTALGAYLTQYRHYLRGQAATPLGTAV